MIELSKIKNYRVCIVKHTLTPRGGVEEELLDYLRYKTKTILYISHPFKEAGLVDPRSEISTYRSGALAKKIKAPMVFGPAVFFYIKDVLFTLWYVFRANIRFDLYVGVDNLNAFCGYILKKLGRVKKVVFYVIDYSPKRFRNAFLNRIYRFIDKFACYKSDYIWNISEAMMTARGEHGINLKRCAPYITVPHGNRFREVKRYEMNKIERRRIAYFGQLRMEHGADRILDIFYAIKKEIQNASLVIIGTGELESFMKKRAAELGIDGSVQFKGFIENNQDYEQILARSAIGIAPYPGNDENYKYYCDPGKIKVYLACGLPVVMTKVPLIWQEIRSRKVGFVVNDDLEEIKKAVIKLLKDDLMYAAYKENAVKMASEYSWDNIFENALSKTLEK